MTRRTPRQTWAAVDWYSMKRLVRELGHLASPSEYRDMANAWAAYFAGASWMQGGAPRPRTRWERFVDWCADLLLRVYRRCGGAR